MKTDTVGEVECYSQQEWSRSVSTLGGNKEIEQLG